MATVMAADNAEVDNNLAKLGAGKISLLRIALMVDQQPYLG